MAGASDKNREKPQHYVSGGSRKPRNAPQYTHRNVEGKEVKPTGHLKQEEAMIEPLESGGFGSEVSNISDGILSHCC